MNNLISIDFNQNYSIVFIVIYELEILNEQNTR